MQPISIKRKIMLLRISMILLDVLIFSLIFLVVTLLGYSALRILVLQEDTSGLLFLIPFICFTSIQLTKLRERLKINFKI